MTGATESEADFLSWVIDLARLHGWRVAHFRVALTGKGWRTPVQADGAGFPDLVLARELTEANMQTHNRILFVELKVEDARLSPEQKVWVRLLGAEVWRPSMRDYIQEVMR